MIIYNPKNQRIIKERIAEAEKILSKIKQKYCFITGSFLFKEDYKDIDIFIISRAKKEIKIDNDKARVSIIDFNDLYSLFYHSISKSCIAKNILPQKQLKVTVADFWSVINEAVPLIMSGNENFRKEARNLVLYAEYFRTGDVLDTFQLSEKIEQFKTKEEIIDYINKEIPAIIAKHMKKSYAKRFFYTQAGYYKEIKEYEAQRFLYTLTHSILGVNIHGQSR
jgi:hypothetical protein